MGIFKDTHSVFQKRKSSQNKRFGVQEVYTAMYVKLEYWILGYSAMRIILTKDVNAEYFAKNWQEAKNSAFSENRLHHIQELEDTTAAKKLCICSSYTCQETTFQRTEPDAKMFGNWTMLKLKL